jgi:hypothetical protein
MTTANPFVEPTNKIVIAGEPDERDYEVSGTVTNMIAGRLVKKGASDGLIVIGDKTGPNIGWLGYEQTFAPDKPANIDTAYALADKATVLSGPGTILMGYSEDAVGKGSVMCAGSDGKVRKLYAGSIKTLTVPFTNSATVEVDSGLNLPAGAVVLDAIVEVVTNVADATIDVGILSSESGGNADGFLDGVSCATAGKIAPITSAEAAATLTLGALISTPHKSADATALYGAIPKLWIGNGTATSVSYTTNDKAVTGNIHIMFAEPGVDDSPVALAEETIAAAGKIMLRSLI